jgi:Mn2+/Fe2+ NRAMP family transporter
MEARGFYTILTVATLMGVMLTFTPIDPIAALFWSAVINGVIAVPFMAIMMLMVGRADVMGPFVAPPRLRILGWLATAVMALSVLVMALTWNAGSSDFSPGLFRKYASPCGSFVQSTQQNQPGDCI